jgi:hypothetical protein
MRSHLICEALKTVRNPYLLCHATVKAIRKFHTPKTRTIPETMNDIFERFGKSHSAEQLVMPAEHSAEAQVRAA